MHPRTRNKTRDITKIILTALAGAGGMTLAAMLGAAGSGSRQAKHELTVGIAQYTRVRIREALQRLRMQKFIQFDAHDVAAPIVLTHRGKGRLLRLTLRDRLFGKKRRWDYLWRMVIFDIPEDDRPTRERFHYTLRQAGFYPLQRSVFVAPFSCEQEIEELCAFWELRSCAHIFVTASLGTAEQSVRRFFAREGVTLRGGERAKRIQEVGKREERKK